MILLSIGVLIVLAVLSWRLYWSKDVEIAYETDIFMDVAPDTAVTLVALYPELKSDTLVQSQIEVYTENNKMIKSLRDQQIKGNVSRWWLYFGGKS